MRGLKEGVSVKARHEVKTEHNGIDRTSLRMKGWRGKTRDTAILG